MSRLDIQLLNVRIKRASVPFAISNDVRFELRWMNESYDKWCFFCRINRKCLLFQVAVQLENSMGVFSSDTWSNCSCILYMPFGKVWQLHSISENILEFNADIWYQLLSSANVSFYICSCWMLVTIPRDIASDLTLLDGEKTHKERRKTFLAIVKQYADSRQLSDLVSYNEWVWTRRRRSLKHVYLSFKWLAHWESYLLTKKSSILTLWNVTFLL